MCKSDNFLMHICFLLLRIVLCCWYLLYHTKDRFKRGGAGYGEHCGRVRALSNKPHACERFRAVCAKIKLYKYWRLEGVVDTCTCTYLQTDCH